MNDHVLRTVEPEMKKTDVIAWVKTFELSGSMYTAVRSWKDETIIDTLKAIGYRWDTDFREWMCQVTDRDNSLEDALAYVTAKLLEAGVAVSADSKVIDAAVSGNYVPKALRYIGYNTAANVYRISIPYGDECTDVVRQMGAKWYSAKHGYILPEGAWRKVADLESIYGFKLSPKTKELISELSGIQKVNVKAKEQTKGKGLAGVLESSREILPDLLDN